MIDEPQVRRRSGFTVAETVVAVAVSAAIILSVTQLWTQGNLMSEKGVWRSSCTNQLRLAQRQLKEAIEATSYPIYADALGIWESSPAAPCSTTNWLLALDNAGTVSVAGASRQASFTTTGDIFHFYCCRPVEGANLSASSGGNITAPAAALAGTGTKYQLQIKAYKGNYYAPLQLAWIQTTGTITGVQACPSFTAGTVLPAVTLCTDVTEVDVTMPNVPSPITTPASGIVIQITIKTRDSIDGRSTLTETLKVKSNVAVSYP